MASNIIVSQDTGTAAARGTYTPNNANLAAPAANIPLYSLSSAVYFFLYSPSQTTWVWSIAGSQGATTYYAATNAYSSAAAAVAAGPQGLTYAAQSGAAPTPTVTVQSTSTTPLAPGAPPGLSATPVSGQTAIRLNWAASATSGVTYQVFRGTSAGGESATPLATGISGLTYTDTSATAGTPYFYFTTAFDGTTQSAQSNEASATATTPAAPPQVATPLSIVGENLTGTSLSVKLPALPSGAASWSLQVTNSASSTVQTVPGIAGGAVGVLSGLIKNGAYQLQGLALDASGNILATTDALTVKLDDLTPTATAPSAPDAIAFCGFSSDGLKISIQAPPCPATGTLTILQTRDDGQAQRLGASGGNIQSADVESGRTYTFRAEATNAAGRTQSAHVLQVTAHVRTS